MNIFKRNVKIYSVVTVIIYFFTNVTPLLAADAQPIQQDGSGQFVAVVDPDNQFYDRSFGAQLGQVPAVEKFEEIKTLSPVVGEEIEVRCTALTKECGYDEIVLVEVEKPMDPIQALNPSNPEDRAHIFEAGQIFGTLPTYMSNEYQKDGSTKYSFYDANKNLLGSKIVSNQYIYDLRVSYPQERLDAVSRDLNSSLTLDKTTVAEVMMPPYEYKFHETETWYAADGTKLDETNNEYLNAPQFVRDAAKNLARNLPTSLQVSVFAADDGSYGIRIDNVDSETAGKPGAFESIVIKFKSGNLEIDGVKTLTEVESIQIQFTGRDLDQDATNALLDSARQLARAGVADVLSGSAFLNQSGKNILDGETQAALVLVSQMSVGRNRNAEPGTLNFKIGELGFQVKYGADQETVLTIKNPELQAVVDFISKLQGQLKGYSFHVSKNEDGSYHVSATGRDGLKYDYDAREPMYCVGWRCGGYQPARLDFDLKFEDGKLNLVDGSLKFQREQYYGWFYKVESLYGTFETNADELIFRGLMRLGRESGLSGADQLASALAGLMRSTESQQVEVGGVTHTLFSVDGQNYLLRSRKNLLSAEKITVDRAQQLSALINFVRDAGYYLQPTATIKITGINADGTYSVRIERNETPAAGDFSAMNFRVEFKDGSWQMKTGTAAVVFSGFTLSSAAVQGLIDGLRNPPAPAYQLHLAAVLGELAKIKIQSINTATGITVFSRGGFDYELVRERVNGVFKYSVRVRIADDMVDLGNGQFLKINLNHPIAQVILQKLKNGQVNWNSRYDSYGNFTFEHEGVVYTIGTNSAYWVAPGYWYVSMVQATTTEGMMTYQYFNQDGSLTYTWKRFYKQYEDGSSLERNFYADGSVQWERRKNADGSSVEKSFSQDGKLTYESYVAVDGSSNSWWFNQEGQFTQQTRRNADGSGTQTYYYYAYIAGASQLTAVNLFTLNGELISKSEFFHNDAGKLIRVERKNATGELLSTTEIDMDTNRGTVTRADGIKVIIDVGGIVTYKMLYVIAVAEEQAVSKQVKDYLAQLQLQLGNSWKVIATMQDDGAFSVTISFDMHCPEGAYCMPRLIMEGGFASASFTLIDQGELVMDSINLNYNGKIVNSALIFHGLRRILSGNTYSKNGSEMIIRFITDQEVFKAMTQIRVLETGENLIIEKEGVKYKIYRDENEMVIVEKLIPDGGQPVPQADLGIVTQLFGDVWYQEVQHIQCDGLGCVSTSSVTIYFGRDGQPLGRKYQSGSEITFEPQSNIEKIASGGFGVIYHYGDLTGREGKGITEIRFISRERADIFVELDYTDVGQYPVNFKAVEAAVAHLLNSIEVSRLTLKNYKHEGGPCVESVPGYCLPQIQFSLESGEKIYRYAISMRIDAPFNHERVVSVRLLEELSVDSPAVLAVKSFVMQDLIKSFGISRLKELLEAGLIKIRVDLASLTVLVEIDSSVKVPNETANLFDPLGSNLLPSQINYTLGKSQPLMMGVPCSVSADGVTDCAKEPDPIYFLKSAHFNVGDKIFRANYLPELNTETGVIRLESPGDNRLRLVTIFSVVDNCQGGDVCTHQYLESFLGQLKYEYDANGAIKIFSGMELDGEGRFPLGKAIHLELIEGVSYRITEVIEFDDQGNQAIINYFQYEPEPGISMVPPRYPTGTLTLIKREGEGFGTAITLQPSMADFSNPGARIAHIERFDGETKQVAFYSLQQLLDITAAFEQEVFSRDRIPEIVDTVVANEGKSSAEILMEKIQRGEIVGYSENEDEEEKKRKAA